MSKKDKIVGSAAIVALGIIFFIVGYFINSKSAFDDKELLKEVEIAEKVLSNHDSKDKNISINEDSVEKNQLLDKNSRDINVIKENYNGGKDKELMEDDGNTVHNSVEYIVVDIEGAVSNPGVYSIEKGKRLNDLIKLSGGITEEAHMKGVNKAIVLSDEGYYYIYSEGEERENNQDDFINKESNFKLKIEENNDKKININRASINELMDIPGIGEVRAKSIVEFRKKNNGFKSVEELKKITGIGEKTYDKLSHLVDIR